VYSILLNREHAEDVVSDTFFAAYLSYEGYDPETSSPVTWLSRIAHNKAVDLVRSASYRKKEELTEQTPVQTQGDIAGEIVMNETLRWLYEQLSEAERELLNMRYTMDMKDAEVAELYELPVKTINKRYQRLLAKCRELLDGKEKIKI